MQSLAGESFPRSSRLVKAEDFKQVFSRNIRVGDDSFTLLISKQHSLASRLGFAIAKKQIKRAVDRNRIKRLIRESFRQQQKTLPNRDIVVMVRHNILKLNNRQILQRLDKHWQSVARKCEDYSQP